MIGSAFDFERPIEEIENLLNELKSPERQSEALKEGIDLTAKIAELESQLRAVMQHVYSNLTPWETTQLARHRNRPYSLDYIRLIFEDFFELSGDRLASNDEAIVGGPARLNGRNVMVIGQQKGRDIKERQRRNFGSARAEGFRKALRLAKMAEKFRLPLFSFVDTAGAAADLRAEEMGVSEAIARNLREFAFLKIPITVVIIGEGGSGGALGLAMGDRTFMLEHAIYSVISPEGCASILWHDKNLANEAAQALKLTSRCVYDLGILDRILPEPLGGAHRDPTSAAAIIKDAFLQSLDEMDQIQDVQKLVESRYSKIRRLGKYLDTTSLEEN
jgi:acetyl-CoA carboxylase carboxyl transferase subunit alpha